MSGISSGDYAHARVPTVFVEEAPRVDQAPASARERSGSNTGAIVAVGILLIGMLLAGLGGLFYFYNQEVSKVSALTASSGKMERDLAAATKALEAERGKLAVATTSLTAMTTQYGQIEKLKNDAAILQKNIADLLARRPGVAGLPAALQQPPFWKETAEQTLTRHITALQAQFDRIDKSGAPRPAEVTPSQPNIRPN